MAKPSTLRIPDDDLAEIDRRAGARGLTRSAFVVDVRWDAPPHTPDADQLRDELHLGAERLERVEVATFRS